jgi:flavin reductase (DIM6/NTAB) family NADH-FMN oxidoreductase RutF
MAIDGDLFKRVLGSFASGVTIVTMQDGSGERRGMTVSAFSSVSLDPPLVLICIDRKADSLPGLQETGRFAVNILGEGQDELSRRFAAKDVDRFAGVRLRPGATGLPLLEGALGVLECRVVHQHPAGDHIIFVGEVEAAAVEPAAPLLHFRGRYGAFAPLG